MSENDNWKYETHEKIIRAVYPSYTTYVLVKVLYSFDVRRFSNTVSGVNVTWRRIRARSNPESLISQSDLEWLISGEFLISSESDLDEFVLEEVVSPSDANDEGLSRW